MNETPLPTTGTYVDYAVAVCPAWPNSSEPATAEDAARAMRWEGPWQVVSCRWRHTKAAYFTLSPETQLGPGMVAFRITIGENRSSAAKRHQKFLFCETHQQYATKMYIRENSWYYIVRAKLSNWWSFTHVKTMSPSGYATMKMVAIRKNLIDTMRKMW